MSESPRLHRIIVAPSELDLTEHQLTGKQAELGRPRQLLTQLQADSDRARRELARVLSQTSSRLRRRILPAMIRVRSTFGAGVQEIKQAWIDPAESYGRVARKVARSVLSEKTVHITTRPSCDRFALYTSSSGNYFFEDIRDVLAAGLEELGFRVDLCDECHDFDNRADWHIVFAPHEFFTLGRGAKLLRGELPRALILINTEQPSTQWFALAAATFGRAHHLWDINYDSAQAIRARGFACDYLPLGYVQNVKALREVSALPEHYGTSCLDPDVRNRSYLDQPLSDRPIDILFVGRLTPRREEFLARAASMLSSYRCYLHLSDTWEPILPGLNTFMNTATVVGLAQRAKIVLNLHHGQDRYFEWHRIVMQGIWQRALVVSEPCGVAPPFRPGVDFVEAELEKIPETIAHYLSSPEGQEEGQSIAEHGFETLTRDCKLADSLRPLILGLYKVPRLPEPMWQRTGPPQRVDPPTPSPQQELHQFVHHYPVLPRSDFDVQHAKMSLVRGVGRADSIRDYGGLWEVHGLYMLEGARALRCTYAEMIDITPREEFWQKAQEFQSRFPTIRIEMRQADFRDPELYGQLRPVDVSLLYDILLHQDNPEDVIKWVCNRTLRCVCVAQPMLKESMFVLPNGTVNLQFYPEELKDLLRFDGWWSKESAVDRFDTRYWMWGQTVSYLRSVFYGYGWDQQHLEAYDLSRHWTFALMRFAPREKT